MNPEDQKKAKEYLSLNNLPISKEELLRAQDLVTAYWRENDTLRSFNAGDKLDFALQFIQRKIDALDAENQRKANHQATNKTLQYARWTAIASWAAVSVALLTTLWSSYQNGERFIREQRPYLGTYVNPQSKVGEGLPNASSTDPIIAECAYEAARLINGSIIVNFPIKNYGKTPAKYSIEKIEMTAKGKIFPVPSQLFTPNGFLMPDEAINIRYGVPLETIKFDPDIEVYEIKFEALIHYSDIGDDRKYGTTISLEPQVMRSGSGSHCLQLINREAK